MTTSPRRRTQRIEVKATEEERALIDQAVRHSGGDFTTFVLSHLLEASRSVLADRDRFELSAEATSEWERINSAPARNLPGLRALIERQSPFVDSE